MTAEVTRIIDTAAATLIGGAADAIVNNTRAQAGVGATETTVQPAEVDATAAESTSLCDRAAAFFKGIADSVSNFVLNILNTVKGWFVKAEAPSTPENTEGTTTTNTEETTNVEGTTTTTTTTETEEVVPPTREQQLTNGIAKLRALEALIAGGTTLEAVRENFRNELAVGDQNAIRQKMFRLATPADPANLQPGDRINNNPNFANRVILGQVRLASETADRADIQHHADNLLADGSIFRQAIEQIATQYDAELVALPITTALNTLQEVISVEAPDIAAVRLAFYAIPDDAVRSAVRNRMWNLAAPDAANPQAHDRRSAPHWANRVIMNEVQLDTEAQPRVDIQHHADNLLADGSIFRQAVEAIIAERA